jgi:hypothetical protein
LLDEISRLDQKVKKRNISNRPKDEIRHNLYIYYETLLWSIKADYTKRRTSQGLTINPPLIGWHTPGNINNLVQKSETIFQYATVACRIIREQGESPVV